MAGHLSKAEATAYQERWERVNEADRAQLRAMTVEEKFRHLSSLMQWARAFGWDEALAAEEDEVRRRWNRLRKVYCG